MSQCIGEALRSQGCTRASRRPAAAGHISFRCVRPERLTLCDPMLTASRYATRNLRGCVNVRREMREVTCVRRCAAAVGSVR
eukprot:760812-Hanusia_phi.AAC.7